MFVLGLYYCEALKGGLKSTVEFSNIDIQRKVS